MLSQYDLVRQDRRYYPFTENNPFAPWYTKWRIAMFGETAVESLDRFRHKQFAYRVLESLAVSNNQFTNVEGLTPAVTLGLGIKTPMFNIVEGLHALNLETKLNSIAPTPKTIPAIPQYLLPEIEEWKTFDRVPDLTLDELELFSKIETITKDLD